MVHTANQILFLCMILLLICAAVVKGYQFGYDLFAPLAVSQNAGDRVVVSLQLNETENFSDIGKKLQSAGVISDWYLFQSEAELFGCRVASGTYKLSSDMTNREIIEQLKTEYLRAQNRVSDNK